MAWMRHAACAPRPDLFFPPYHQPRGRRANLRVALARRVCASCSVRERHCWPYAVWLLATFPANEDHAASVTAGLTVGERVAAVAAGVAVAPPIPPLKRGELVARILEEHVMLTHLCDACATPILRAMNERGERVLVEAAVNPLGQVVVIGTGDDLLVEPYEDGARCDRHEEHTPRRCVAAQMDAARERQRELEGNRKRRTA